MSKTMSWPSRVIYILIALALAISLAGIAAVPSNTNADPGLTKWTKVTTPSEKNETIFPGSNLYDFAVGPDGEVIYVIGEGPDKDDIDTDTDKAEIIPQLWKSTDGGATWSNKTSKLLKAKVKLDLPAEFAMFTQVAVAPDDEDLVIVAGTLAAPHAGEPAVVGSNDGATKFYYTGALPVGATARILCMDVSRGVDDVYNIAVGTDDGYVCRYEAGKYWGARWIDASAYSGWKASTAVTSIAFSPSWSADKTVLAISTDGSETWLQSGLWGTRKGWGSVVERASAVRFEINTTPVAPVAIFPGVTGMALPSDYDGYESAMRRVYTYVDAAAIAGVTAGGYFFRIDSTTLSFPCGPEAPLGHAGPWFASIAYHGTHDEGKTMIGMLGEGAPVWPPTVTACCKGVQVWRTAEPDVCCPDWKKATKKPTGQAYALVAFTSDGKKAYAITQDEGLAGESAFSVSLDDGKCWNQLGLIDTDIDRLSDTAVSPDCSVTYLASVNELETDEVCGCDSVWMKDSEAEEYADVWQRVYHKALAGADEVGLLRLSPEHEDGDVVYWGDLGAEKLYFALSKGICKWSSKNPTIKIQDFALADDDTIYVTNDEDDLIKWAEPKRDWTSAVDHKAVEGHTIAVLGDYVLVGGATGSVGYSDDGAASFSRIGDKGILNGNVHVAFDSYFEDNDTIYAAVADGGTKNGVHRWVIDVSTSWKDLKATVQDYYGIVLDNADGNPKTSATTGGVLYAAYYVPDDPATAVDEEAMGVARCLTPASTPCCTTEAWDYLTAKLAAVLTLEPSSLKLCGCLTAATNSKLFAIDNDAYQLSDGKDGTVWTYEDCFAKEGVTLSAVKDGATVASDPCICANEKFVLSWDRLCNACEYEFDISLDDGFTQIVRDETDYTPVGPGGYYDPPKNEAPSVVIAEGDLDCNTTYYWRVRAHYAETGETIASWWSDTWDFTVEAGPAIAIDLTAPKDGATDVVVTGVGFTWTSVSGATSYDWVLAPNADLSSPLETKTGLTGTAYTYTGTLDYETSYFWQVTAMKDGKVFSKSDVSTFTTVAAPPPPPPPYPELVIPPPVTPAWVWVVIGIGAVLVIVVIVLIFRTRRV